MIVKTTSHFYERNLVAKSILNLQLQDPFFKFKDKRESKETIQQETTGTSSSNEISVFASTIMKMMMSSSL
jgi:hypothetical protein